ncbi:DUF2752 domain-containing protein [Rosettibacter firmus]|uniref:DUF2752 domain-containing protein n=1 Tax=Rosettibacter firmus TaxID=3111522 RepID=UPI00336BFFCA
MAQIKLIGFDIKYKSRITKYLNAFNFIIKKIEWEAIAWIMGFIFLMLINPYAEQTFTLCPLNNMGITYCPGCGLGRSISFIFHFDFSNSFKSHPLGLIALIIILHRIIMLVMKTYNNFKLRESI